MQLACFHCRQNLIEFSRRIRIELLHLLGSNHSFSDKAVAPDFSRRRMRFDLLVKRRLRECRLVGLVVSVTPIANEIDQEILAEFCAILDAESNEMKAGLRNISGDVNDRHLEAFSQ